MSDYVKAMRMHNGEEKKIDFQSLGNFPAMKVGQFLQVAAVDENGQPTAWVAYNELDGELVLQRYGLGGYSRLKKNANADGDYGLQLQDYGDDGSFMGLTVCAKSQKLEFKKKAAGATEYTYPTIYSSDNPQRSVEGDYPQYELIASDGHKSMWGKSADAANDYGTVIRDTNGEETVEIKLRAGNKQAKLCFGGKEYAFYHEGNLADLRDALKAIWEG